MFKSPWNQFRLIYYSYALWNMHNSSLETAQSSTQYCQHLDSKAQVRFQPGHIPFSTYLSLFFFFSMCKLKTVSLSYLFHLWNNLWNLWIIFKISYFYNLWNLYHALQFPKVVCTLFFDPPRTPYYIHFTDEKYKALDS